MKENIRMSHSYSFFLAVNKHCFCEFVECFINIVNYLIYLACISEFDTSSSSCCAAVFVFSNLASWPQ